MDKYTASFGIVALIVGGSLVALFMIVVIQPAGCLSYEIDRDGTIRTIWNPLGSNECQQIVAQAVSPENIKDTVVAKNEFLTKNNIVEIKQDEYEKLTNDSIILREIDVSNDVLLLKILGLEDKLIDTKTELEQAKIERDESMKIYLRQLSSLQTVVSSVDEQREIESQISLINFSPTIELDHKTYSWTDKVDITIVYPNGNQDPKKIDTIGTDIGEELYIETSKGVILEYSLQETGPDTGIFTGEVTLTGFPGIDVNNDGNIDEPTGNTSGFGPNDGFLATEPEDGISVVYEFKPDEKVVSSALIRWNVAHIQFVEKTSYQINEAATIRVVDPDLNLNPDRIDFVKVNVTSDSFGKGILVNLKETNTESGIFEDVIKFTLSQKPNQNMLRVALGDSIYATYVDKTLPIPVESLELGALASIKERVLPG